MATGSPRQRRASWLIAVAMVAGAGALAWYATDGEADGSIPTAGETATMAPVLAEESGLAWDAATYGALPTRVIVPAAGIDAAVSEVGVTVTKGKPVWETAWRSAGHHLDSARPGQPGNMVIAGHVSVADDGNEAVFRRLNRIKPGDIVEVYSGDSVYGYRVGDIRVVEPSAVDVLRSGPRSIVTLITCTEDLENRLVVVGELIPGYESS